MFDQKNLEKVTVAIIGGCGHVGLPLGVNFALAGAVTKLVDINDAAITMVNKGNFPFLENGGDTQLQKALSTGRIEATNNPKVVAEADAIVFVTGTPVDEHLNPKISEVTKILSFYEKYFSDDNLIIMRSTLAPGTMEYIFYSLKKKKCNVRLAFCPERVTQGNALDEINSLPQIVGAFDEESFQAAYNLFAQLAPEIIRLTPLEAEITKLMANTWRYLEFAIANQLYLIAEKRGVDFYRIYDAIRYKYPRAKGYKSPGFAAGPCLFKDTMQLSSFFDHQFHVGHASMLINEGLASFAVEKIKTLLDGSLWRRSVGLLGMAFKANSDDIRESLSFRVKKGLEFAGAEVKFHDPYIKQSVTLDEVLQCDGIILCTPHRKYLELIIDKPLVDVWGILRKNKIEVLPGTDKESKKLSQVSEG